MPSADNYNHKQKSIVFLEDTSMPRLTLALLLLFSIIIIFEDFARATHAYARTVLSKDACLFVCLSVCHNYHRYSFIAQ